MAQYDGQCMKFSLGFSVDDDTCLDGLFQHVAIRNLSGLIPYEYWLILALNKKI